jgi:hypothetical protein
MGEVGLVRCVVGCAARAGWFNFSIIIHTSGGSSLLLFKVLYCKPFLTKTQFDSLYHHQVNNYSYIRVLDTKFFVIAF